MRFEILKQKLINCKKQCINKMFCLVFQHNGNLSRKFVVKGSLPHSLNQKEFFSGIEQQPLSFVKIFYNDKEGQFFENMFCNKIDGMQM